MTTKLSLLASAAFASALALSYPALSADDVSNADPACVITNADGTKSLDTQKCKDGKPMAANENAAPADATTGTNANQAPAASGDSNNAANTGATTADPAATATTSPANGLIVAPDSIAGARVMTASDFIGKRVYTRAGDDIGEVNDLFVTDKGNVQAVVLGVGGFLGIGEKDVAISMNAIEMVPDGNAVRLVVDASKEQLEAAPGYDRSKRTYITN